MRSTTTVQEEPIVFECQGETLLGIVSRSSDAATRNPPETGAIIVVGGPQYRAGSHRQFVQWARALAAAGTPALRFDVRGMGDSTGELRSFTTLSADIGAAIDAFETTCPEVKRIILCGLCDGASAVLLYLHECRDPRVAGLVLLNPWVRSEQSQARTLVRHYYLRRLLSRAFWAKLLRGGVALRSLRDLAGHVGTARKTDAAADRETSYQYKMANALRVLNGPVLLTLSGEDYTAKEFVQFADSDAAWRGLLARSSLQRLDLPGADHTLSATSDRLRFEAASLAWFAAIEPGAA